MEGEGKAESLGKSIIVPSVQELAKGCLQEIPERYVHYDQESPTVVADEELEVPIINMETLINGDEHELLNLHSACQEWGFFQLINHEVSSTLVDEFKLQTQQFFDLPLEEKKKYWQTPTDLEGFGQAFVVSEDQKLDWGDMFYMVTFPTHLRKPYLFPILPLPYRHTIENYSIEVRKISQKILEYMAKALKIDASKLLAFGEGYQSIRMNYYPPCPKPEKVIGLTAHTDSISLITILLQANGVQGLQIYKNNNWVPINPLPGAFVVNIGDILEIMTNGIYKSVLHRAMVNATKERISVSAFHAPALDLEIGPIPDLVTSTNPVKFRRIIMAEFWKHFLAHPLDAEKCIDFMKIPSLE